MKFVQASVVKFFPDDVQDKVNYEIQPSPVLSSCLAEAGNQLIYQMIETVTFDHQLTQFHAEHGTVSGRHGDDDFEAGGEFTGRLFITSMQSPPSIWFSGSTAASAAFNLLVISALSSALAPAFVPIC